MESSKHDVSVAAERSPACFDGGLCVLLKSLRLKKYWPLFEKRLEIDAAFELNDLSLKELGLPLGARKKLLVKLLQLSGEEKENGDVAVRPSGHMTRIRRVVKQGCEPMPPTGKQKKCKEPLSEQFRIERIQSAAFDRLLEMQTIEALYFRSPPNA